MCTNKDIGKECTFSSDAINAEVIRQIESCLFIVCLDDSPQASAICE